MFAIFAIRVRIAISAIFVILLLDCVLAHIDLGFFFAVFDFSPFLLRLRLLLKKATYVGAEWNE